MRLDGKVRIEGGKLIQNKDGKEVPEDEFIVFRPHDNAVPALLNVYRTMCIDLGAGMGQIEALDGLIRRVHDWRASHPERLKVADVERGEIRTE